MSTRRLKNKVISKAIVVGSISYLQSSGSTAEKYSLHQWALYVRGVNHEDLSHIIGSVEFDLDPSFSQPHRIISSPGPFVLVESGWGEFVVSITLRFVNELEKPVSLFHSIRLFDSAHPAPVRTGTNAPPVALPPAPLTPDGKPYPYVLSEHYDEIVFVNPTEAMYERVMKTKPRPAIEVAPLPAKTMQIMNPVFQVTPEAFSDKQDLNDIALADATISADLVRLNTEYAKLEAQEQAFKLYIQRYQSRYPQQVRQQQLVQQQQQQQMQQRRAASAAATSVDSSSKMT